MAEHPYYKVDAGSPHTQPEDYQKLGLGEFNPNQSYSDMAGEPSPQDLQLAELLREKLRQQPQFQRVDVHVVNNHVRLSGVVETRYDGQQAESLITGTEGVAGVHNDIRVQPTEETSGGPTLTVHEPGANNTGSTQRS